MSEPTLPVAEVPRSRIARIGSRWAALWHGGMAVVRSLLPILGVAFVVTLLAREVMRRDIEVAPIAVPSKLSDAGITPEIAATWLLESVLAVARDIHDEEVERPAAQVEGATPDFNVPIAGLSLRSTAAVVRNMLGISVPRIGGEIVLDGAETIAIRLRVDGHGQVVQIGGAPAASPEALLAQAAPAVWRVLSPHVYAWHLGDTVTDQEALREQLAALRRANPGDLPTRRTIDFLTGRSLVRSGRPAEALPIFEALKQEAPNFAPGWHGHGLAMDALNRGEDALLDEQRALALDPRSIWTRLALAGLLRDLRRYEESLEQARAAMQISPEDWRPHVAASTTQRLARRLPQAIEAARRAMALAPAEAQPRWALATALRNQGEYDQAEAAFQAGLQRADTPAEKVQLHVGRADLLERRGDREAALAEARAAVAADPRDYEGYLTEGWLLRNMGRHAEALAAFDAALARRSHHLGAIRGRSLSLASLGRTDEAVGAARLGIDRDPRNASAHVGLGVLLRQLDRREEALAAADRALELAPDDAGALGLRANLLRELHRDAAALEAARTYVRLFPNAPEAQTMLGQALIATSDGEGAVAAYDAALGFGGASAAFQAGRAMAFLAAGRLPEAENQARSVLADSPRQASAQLVLAWAVLRQNRAAEALPLFEGLERRHGVLVPHLPVSSLAGSVNAESAHLGHGMALAALGRKAEAAAAIEASLAITELPGARAALAQLTP